MAHKRAPCLAALPTAAAPTAAPPHCSRCLPPPYAYTSTCKADWGSVCWSARRCSRGWDGSAHSEAPLTVRAPTVRAPTARAVVTDGRQVFAAARAALLAPTRLHLRVAGRSPTSEPAGSAKALLRSNSATEPQDTAGVGDEDGETCSRSGPPGAFKRP